MHICCNKNSIVYLKLYNALQIMTLKGTADERKKRKALVFFKRIKKREEI